MGRLGIASAKVGALSAEFLNLLNRRDHDIDYAYESRIAPAVTSTFSNVFHPVEPFQMRFWLRRTFGNVVPLTVFRRAFTERLIILRNTYACLVEMLAGATGSLAAATELFADKDFHGTTTKEIAARAEVTESLIFRYFENKETLYRAVIEDYVENSRRPDWNGIRDCMARNADADLIKALIAYVIEAYRTYPIMQRLVLYAILEG